MAEIKIGSRFYAQRDRWDMNQKIAQSIRVVPATVAAPGGDQYPGVTVLCNRGVMLVLTEAQALALANDIADVLEADRK